MAILCLYIFIHDAFNPEIVNNLVKRQRIVVKKMKDEEKDLVEVK